MTDTVARQPSTPGGPPVRGVASIAAALGLGAVTAAAACCVLPLALASLGSPKEHAANRNLPHRGKAEKAERSAEKFVQACAQGWSV